MTVLAQLKHYVRSTIYKINPDFFLKDFWKKRGKDYAKEVQSESYRQMYDMIAALCLAEKPAHILEYGCGYGYLLKRTSELDKKREIQEYNGIDFSGTQIQNARINFPHGKFVQADLTKGLDFYANRKFDVVVGVGVLMYIQPDHIHAVIAELARVCRKKILLAEYYFKFLNQDIQARYLNANKHDGRCVYDYESLLKEHGFRDVKIERLKCFEDPSINTLNEMPQMLIAGTK